MSLTVARDWPHPDDPPPTRRDRWLLAIEATLIAVLMLFGAIASATAKDHPVPARGTAFRCTAVAVWDGDGPIWCAEGPRIRLANISARELDGSCRPHAHCVAANGIAARDALVTLLGGARGTTRDGHVRVAAPLRCRSRGPDRYRRTLATCAGGGGDIGMAMIARRAAARY